MGILSGIIRVLTFVFLRLIDFVLILPLFRRREEKVLQNPSQPCRASRVPVFRESRQAEANR